MQFLKVIAFILVSTVSFQTFAYEKTTRVSDQARMRALLLNMPKTVQKIQVEELVRGEKLKLTSINMRFSYNPGNTGYSYGYPMPAGNTCNVKSGTVTLVNTLGEQRVVALASETIPCPKF